MWLTRRRYRWASGRTPAEVFTEIYRTGHWGGQESASGPGSDAAETDAVVAALPGLLVRLGVAHLVDVPCGDFNWMPRVLAHPDLSTLRYTGGDIVAPLIEANRDRYGGDGIGGGRVRFDVVDLIAGPVPRGDLVLCRDCLFHLSFADARAALANIKVSGCRWLLTTTYPHAAGWSNLDMTTGGWRRVDLTRPPFDLPQPRELLADYAPSDAGRPTFQKHLGLWACADMPGGGPARTGPAAAAAA